MKPRKFQRNRISSKEIDWVKKVLRIFLIEVLGEGQGLSRVIILKIRKVRGPKNKYKIGEVVEILLFIHFNEFITF